LFLVSWQRNPKVSARSFTDGFVKGAAAFVLFALVCFCGGVLAHVAAVLVLLGWRLLA
jgi:hypothetical protein